LSSFVLWLLMKSARGLGWSKRSQELAWTCSPKSMQIEMSQNFWERFESSQNVAKRFFSDHACVTRFKVATISSHTRLRVITHSVDSSGVTLTSPCLLSSYYRDRRFRSINHWLLTQVDCGATDGLPWASSHCRSWYTNTHFTE
jgi:hypothetical protein